MQQSMKFDVSSIKQVISALSSQIRGFNRVFSAGSWQIVINGKESIDMQELNMRSDKIHSVDIIPALCGSGGGFGKILIGAALIGAAFLTAGGSFAAVGAIGKSVIGMGVSMVAGGVLGLISPPPAAPNHEQQQVAKNASSLFDGPRNRAGVGLMIPIIYGQVRTGSLTVSSHYEVSHTVVAS